MLPASNSARHPTRHALGLLWWNNADGTLARVPTDAFWSWGLHDSLIVVIPSLDLVIARAGQSWKREAWSAHYDVLAPFLEPIATAANTNVPTALPTLAPATPPSPVIREIIWAPPDTILRLAKGSDNWPVTSADDGSLYGAYGDGYGFKPFLPPKLSLGLVRIEGVPPHLTGINFRSPDIEQVGDGPAASRPAACSWSTARSIFSLATPTTHSWPAPKIEASPGPGRTGALPKVSAAPLS